MKLNGKKTKFMIFNYTHKWQFNTRLYINNLLLEQVQDASLLGLTIQENLGWHHHIGNIVKKGYARMRLITGLVKFGVKISDLVNIHIKYIRSVL